MKLPKEKMRLPSEHLPSQSSGIKSVEYNDEKTT